MRKYLALICLLSLGIASGCAKKVAIHPGAVSNIDSYSYDLLIGEQSALTQASADFKAGNLPSEAKAPLNAAIASYNVALAAWQSYHASGGDASKLQAATSALIAAVGELQKVLGKNPATVSGILAFQEVAA